MLNAGGRTAVAFVTASGDDFVSERWERSAILLLCVVAALRVFVFAAAFPFFNNVDEPAHVDLVLKYARGYWPRHAIERFEPGVGRLIAMYGTPEYLTATEKLPGGRVPRPLWENSGLADRVAGEAATAWAEQVNHEAHSPPVYYAVAGAWYRLGEGLGFGDAQRLYWIRFLNVPLIALLVWCSYLFCRRWYADRPELRSCVPLLVAFLPQDVFYSVHGDVLSPLAFAVSLAAVLTWYHRPSPGVVFSAAVGLLVALTFLVKHTNVALPLIFGTAVLFKIRRLRRDGREWAALVAVVAAAAPVAFYFGRNYAALGDLTGIQTRMELQDWSRRPIGRLLAHPIFTPSGLWTFWDGLMRTFWRGEFAWHFQPISSPWLDGFYVVSSATFLAAAATASLVCAARARDNTSGIPAVNITVPVALWASLILSVGCLATLSVSFEYGRSFYPSREYPFFASGRLIGGMLIPFLILYVEGLSVLTRRLSHRANPLWLVTLISLMMTVSEVVSKREVFSSPYNWFHLP